MCLESRGNIALPNALPTAKNRYGKMRDSLASALLPLRVGRFRFAASERFLAVSGANRAAIVFQLSRIFLSLSSLTFFCRLFSWDFFWTVH